jgi:hypothetical protein
MRAFFAIIKGWFVNLLASVKKGLENSKSILILIFTSGHLVEILDYFAY